MKNKMKKIIAMVLMGAMLCGTALEVQAATRVACVAHQGEWRNVRNAGTSESSHVAPTGQTCRVIYVYKIVDVYCSLCGEQLYSNVKVLFDEIHSENHNQ